MRRYESVVILDPELPEEEIVGFTERCSRLIKEHGGEIIKIEDWGSKKLAYLVKKKDRARYILFDFVGLPALIMELERQFKIAEEVMKFLSVKLDDEVDLEAFKARTEEKKVQVEPVSEESPAAGTEMASLPSAEEENAVAGVQYSMEPTAGTPEAEASPEQADTGIGSKNGPDTAAPDGAPAAEGVKEEA
jgi:small subunit ribosomal protein S6